MGVVTGIENKNPVPCLLGMQTQGRGSLSFIGRYRIPPLAAWPALRPDRPPVAGLAAFFPPSYRAPEAAHPMAWWWCLAPSAYRLYLVSSPVHQAVVELFREVVLHFLQVVHFNGYGLSGCAVRLLAGRNTRGDHVIGIGSVGQAGKTSPAVSPHSWPFATTERSLSTTKVRRAGSSAGGTSSMAVAGPVLDLPREPPLWRLLLVARPIAPSLLRRSLA